MNILIAGFGALGKRHFQSVMNFKGHLTVDLFDIHRTAFTDDVLENNRCFTKLPTQQEYDLVIISTSSKERFDICNKIVLSNSVKTIIFEKFVFNTISEFELTQRVLDFHSIKAYVNTPMRMYAIFNDIRNQIQVEGGDVEISVEGSGWGLACNAIHFIDLFEYLTGCIISPLHKKSRDLKLESSKREGYVEAFGSLTGSSGAHSLSLSCKPGEFNRIISVKSGCRNLEITESKRGFDMGSSGFDVDRIERFPFQSELTCALLDELFLGEINSIPDFSISSSQHIKFINVINLNLASRLGHGIAIT